MPRPVSQVLIPPDPLLFSATQTPAAFWGCPRAWVSLPAQRQGGAGRGAWTLESETPAGSWFGDSRAGLTLSNSFQFLDFPFLHLWNGDSNRCAQQRTNGE